MANRLAVKCRRQVLADLAKGLGNDWRTQGSSIVYRVAAPYLVQWISLDTSRFSTDFNVACYVQVLAHSSAFWAGHIGDRVRERARGSELSVSVGDGSAAKRILDLLIKQSQPSVLEPLTIAAAEVASRNQTLDAATLHLDWCRGLLLAMLDRPADAGTDLRLAASKLDELRKAWRSSGMDPVDWAEDGAAELVLLNELLDDRPAFEAHCLDNAHRNSTALRISLANPYLEQQ
jgi:hypothetical protein